ncbi:MAG: hypothetical protein ACKO1U_07615 [Bacteroidota bacterium]
MGIKELQYLIHRKGTFHFNDGKNLDGMIVSRYNISLGRVEYYFIPAEKMSDYDTARHQHDVEAHRRLGMRIEASSISSAKLAAA